MEAYKLCAKDLFSGFCAKKTGSRLGWINCILFGTSSVFLTGWALVGLFCPRKPNPDLNLNDNFFHHQENSDWEVYTRGRLPQVFKFSNNIFLHLVFESNSFCYVYIFYCLLQFEATLFFIAGVMRVSSTKFC